MVLGHIDHGKTTLLDQIRKKAAPSGGEPRPVAGRESGGITQHIGAYEIELKTKNQELKTITFIDTPGHEAFSKMRSRGANVADLALLVVAADDGVKPQTEEALKAITSAKLPFIVVLNKIDKETSDPNRVKKELGDKGVILEEWGGKTPVVQISAKTGQGLEELLELILLVSELENLETDFSKPAVGVVIESRLDSKRGNAATLLLREGSLKKGNFVLAGSAAVKVIILEDFNGRPVEEASASSPVRAIGFDAIPLVGSTFRTFSSKDELEQARLAVPEDVKNGHKFEVAEGQKTIPVVLKADAAGSLEAIEHELRKFENEKLGLNLIRSEVGTILEDDLKLASSSGETIVIGFRVKLDRSAKELSERFGIALGIFDVIYELVDWAREEIEKRLPEDKTRKVLGRGRVLKIFKKEGSRQIVGGKMESGGIYEKKNFTLLRRDFPLTAGRISGLQVGKMEVKEVLEGKEFGALVDSEIEIAPGDVLEIFEIEITKRQVGG